MPLLPESGVKLTYEDYLEIPADLLRHEIVDGVHYVNSAPATYHQLISARLASELVVLIMKSGLGTVFAAPTDVELSPHDIVQPDLIAIRTSRSEIIHPSRVIGAPDLIVEIISPSTKRYDLREKSPRYAACGVTEFLVVDPATHNVDQYRLHDGAYVHAGRYETTISLASFPGVTIDLAAVW
ncbi:MAG: Uma2 family endonuclease [Planctomycetota bacterium]